MKCARSPRSRSIALVLLAITLTAPSCGEPAGSPSPLSAPAEILSLPPVTRGEKARFALERLLAGPLPRTSRFGIPRLHQLNLEHAQDDLVALADEAVTLLSNADARSRITHPPRGDRNPWHNVLDVIADLPGMPTGLVLAWCEPALGQNDLPLLRRAVHALAATNDVEAAPLLLAFLERRPTDRELAPRAVRALIAFGSPWGERALAIAYQGGDLGLWSKVPGLLAMQEPGGRSVLDTSDALAWWAILTGGSGPRQVRSTARNLVPAWYPARFLLDPAVWPREAGALDHALREGRALAPAGVSDAGGSLPTPTGSSPVLATFQVFLSGRASAARARCYLARAGHPAYVASVGADLTGSDPDLRYQAEHCLGDLSSPEALDDARASIAQLLRALEAGGAPPPTGAIPDLARLFAADSTEAAPLALDLLRLARPPDRYESLLEAAHDLLRVHDEDALRREVCKLARRDDLDDVALAIKLIRRARDPHYVPVVDELFAGATATRRKALCRLLIWLHSGGEKEVDEAARRAFVERYARWIAEAPDAEAQCLVPGLLDLGDAGAEAYARGLGGDRRRVYVEGLSQRAGLVPVGVAAALIGPLDEATPPARRHAILIAAYRTAPGTAAGYLAAARARLAPDVRAEVDDVLEVLRYRAAR